MAAAVTARIGVDPHPDQDRGDDGNRNPEPGDAFQHPGEMTRRSALPGIDGRAPSAAWLARWP